jgi:hypothetical protein
MFQTQNYTHIWCDKCNERTIIEPGKGFTMLNCKCNEKEAHGEVEPRATNQAKRPRQKQ